MHCKIQKYSNDSTVEKLWKCHCQRRRNFTIKGHLRKSKFCTIQFERRSTLCTMFGIDTPYKNLCSYEWTCARNIWIGFRRYIFLEVSSNRCKQIKENYDSVWEGAVPCKFWCFSSVQLFQKYFLKNNHVKKVSSLDWFCNRNCSRRMHYCFYFLIVLQGVFASL